MKIFIWVFSLIFGSLAFFGISKYNDLLRLVKETDIVHQRVQASYKFYLEQDSLNTLRIENSKYYSYYLEDENKRRIREAINKLFDANGFGIADSRIEVKLSEFLYDGDNWTNNDAYRFIYLQDTLKRNTTVIGVLYNGMPQRIINRVDSIFHQIYFDAEIKYFLDERLPKSGFLYYID